MRSKGTNKKERIDILRKELEEYEDKVTYHDGQKLIYMGKATEVLDKLNELGVEIF